MNEPDLAIPLLPSRSLPKTQAFYERLGFEGDMFPDHDYLILTRGSLELHFFLHEALKPEGSAFGCYLRVQDVRPLLALTEGAGLPTLGIPRMHPVEDKPWGMREFAVIDEDGNLVRVGQAL